MLTGSFQGEWWLPASPTIRIRGVLHHGWNQSPRLETHGLLAPEEIGDAIRLLMVGGPSHPIVFGRLADGREVTLQACSGGRGGNEIHLDEPERNVLNYVARRAWIGATLPDPDGVAFDQMEACLTRLDDLAPQPLLAVLPGITIEVVDLPAGHESSSARRACRLTSDMPMPVDEWIDAFVRPMRALAAFSTGRDIAVERLALVDRRAVGGPHQIEIIEKRRGPNREPDRPLLPAELLFDLQSLPMSVESMLGHWLSMAGDLRTVMDLVLGPLFAPFMYEEHRFLNFAQAAESFHRIRIGGSTTPSEEYGRRVEAVLRSCPSDLKAWLGTALQYGNSLSFGARLRQLIGRQSWLSAEVTGQVPRFVRRVTDTRNYHTHWDETTRGQSAQGVALWPLSEQLAVILEACLLREIGFSSEQAAEAVRRASGHYSAIRFNPSLFPGASPVAPS